MEEIIPTSKEYLEKLGDAWEDNGETYADRFSSQNLVEFAKIHVKEALKQASEKAELDWFNGGCSECGSNEINRQSIIDAYDLNNIK